MISASTCTWERSFIAMSLGRRSCLLVIVSWFAHWKDHPPPAEYSRWFIIWMPVFISARKSPNNDLPLDHASCNSQLPPSTLCSQSLFADTWLQGAVYRSKGMWLVIQFHQFCKHTTSKQVMARTLLTKLLLAIDLIIPKMFVLAWAGDPLQSPDRTIAFHHCFAA